MSVANYRTDMRSDTPPAWRLGIRIRRRAVFAYGKGRDARGRGEAGGRQGDLIRH